MPNEHKYILPGEVLTDSHQKLCMCPDWCFAPIAFPGGTEVGIAIRAQKKALEVALQTLGSTAFAVENETKP